MVDDFMKFRFVIPVAPDTDNAGIGAQFDVLFEHGWNPPEPMLQGPRA
jgi:hypothetical protein